jgi:hypothetical protein
MNEALTVEGGIEDEYARGPTVREDATVTSGYSNRCEKWGDIGCADADSGRLKKYKIENIDPSSSDLFIEGFDSNPSRLDAL